MEYIKCDYCGQQGHAGESCRYCGAPLEIKEVAEISDINIKKLSVAIAKEINRKPVFYTDSDAYCGFYYDTL